MTLLELFKSKGDWFAVVECRDWPFFWRKYQMTLCGGSFGIIWRTHDGERIDYDTNRWLENCVDTYKMQRKHA